MSGRRSGGFALKRSLARSVGRLSRLSGRGGGTTLPGRLLLRIAPDAIERLAERLSDGATVISATNGKTTTAGMLSGALRAAGRDPVHNKAGSNMAWGVATALLEQDESEGLFEVDEAWLGEVCAALPVRTLVLANLFRDQLDRYGELERLADEWAEVAKALPASSRLVLNADDPLIADLGRGEGDSSPRVTYFGIEDPAVALPELQHAHDAKHCRRCGAAYSYERAFVGHLGHYACPKCGNARPEPTIAASAIELRGMSGSRFTVTTPAETHDVELPLPGLYNVYNALAALAAADAAGVPLDDAVESLAATEAVFGRVEILEIEAAEVALLLIKNPAGANGVLRTIREESELGDGASLRLWIALNDRIADGRDISWIWDADFELLAGRVGSVTCSGTRAAELALRLDYAGIEREKLTVDHDLVGSFDRAARASGGRLFALPTYTALIDLRTALARRGQAEDYWR